MRHMVVACAVLVGPDRFAPSEADWYAMVVATPGEQLPLPDVPARVVVEGLSR